MILHYCDETKAMFAEESVAAADRRHFIDNVGRLAAQTRAGVVKIEHIVNEDEELAKIVYKGGATRYVNINADSYTAIVRDIFKHID